MKFILKWLVNGAIIVSLLVYYAHASYWSAAVMATVLTIILYFAVDQLVLRFTNDTVAAVVDGILAYGFLWLAARRMDWDLSSGELWVIAVCFGIAEWVIHRYVMHDELTVRAH